MFLPPGNRRFIALDGPAAGALETPAQPAQEPPHVAGMQWHAALALDQRGHPRQRPEVVEKTVGLRPLFERSFQVLLLGRGQLGPTAQRPAFPRVDPGGLTLLFPPRGAHPADAALPGDFRLRNALSQQPHALAPPRFQAIEIPLGLGAHAG